MAWQTLLSQSKAGSKDRRLKTTVSPEEPLNPCEVVDAKNWLSLQILLKAKADQRKLIFRD